MVKRKAEPQDDAPPTPLSRTRTMQETSQVARDFLKRVGHEVHSPLAKTSGRPETRAQHKMRSAVEAMLAPEHKKPEIQSQDEIERYKNQLKMVFRLIDIKKDGFIDQEQLVSAMRDLGKRPRQEKIQGIMEEIDKEKTGKITLDSFVSFMLAKKNIHEEEEDEKPKPKSEASSSSAPMDASDEPAAPASSSVDKGKKKEELPAAPPGLAILNRSSSIINYFTENAGMHEVPEMIYEGHERDLGKNNAFSSFSILLMNFNRKAPLDNLFALANQALHQKGFSVVEINTEEELIDYANSFDQVWIASSDQPTENQERILEQIKKLHSSGKGIGIWAGGEPYVVQANMLLKELLGIELEGSYHGEGEMKLVGLGDQATNKSTLARSLLTTGLTTLCEGAAACAPKAVPADSQVIARSHHNFPVQLAWEGSSQKGRVFLNCSLIPLAKSNEELDAERRMLSNVGVWLLGLEDRMKLGLRLVGDIKADDTIVWEYFLERNQDGKKAGWHPYDEQATKVVEAAYQKFINSDQAENNIRAFITVHSGTFTYEADFKTMTQKNIAHENHKVRKIRRVGGE